MDRWQQIEKLCHAALELEGSQRAAYLEQACAGDRELRQEVESLLRFDKPGERFIEEPAMQAAARMIAQEKPESLLGRQLGAYQIESLLGKGGMGVVYKARDTRLNRSVAVKVLPPNHLSDPERKRRFIQEARAASALNHPNIITIHDIGNEGEMDFIVMEYVQGKTLDQRIPRKGMKLNDALEIASQMADALAKAHSVGIIHRDLKPGNVMVTDSGQVKVLDFGLAKLLEKTPLSEFEGTETLAAEAESLTEKGVILGTVAYMSPEQAEGKKLDTRSDIFSFGSVLYEMVTGRKAFEGDTKVSILAAIMKQEPRPLSQLVPSIPHDLEKIINRSLRKDRERRHQYMAEIKINLQELKEESDSGILAGPTPVIPGFRRFSIRWLLAAGMATFVVGVLIDQALIKQFKPGAFQISQPVVRASMKLEPGHGLDGSRVPPPYGFDHPTRTAMVISSDGRLVVFSAVKENPGPQDKSRLYLWRFDQLEAKPITGTEGGISPFLSPDNRWVGFWADGKLMKVSIDGGVPLVLCDVPRPFGFSWGTDNQIVLARQWDSGLSRVSADGGNPEPLTTPDKSKQEVSHRLPQCLPAGKGILFTIMRHLWDVEPRVAVLEVSRRKSRVLLEDAADARYVATGYLAFLRKGTLMVFPFDLDRLEIAGQPVPAVANIAQALNAGNGGWDSASGQFSISASGSLVYASGGILADPQNSLVWVDHKGKAKPIASFKGPFVNPRISPDGLRLSYSTWGMERYIWLYDLNRGTATKLTSEGLGDFGIWTRDGRRLLFDWWKTGMPNIYWQSLNEGSPMEQLTQSEYIQVPGSWSPDGETLAFVEFHPETGNDIELLSIRDRRVKPFLNSRFSEQYPEFSPDGRWVAYGSDESGRREVYVEPFPGPGSKQLISKNGGQEPLWARNGKQLFYRSGEPGYYAASEWVRGQVWVVDVQTGSGFSAGKPRLLFDQPGYDYGDPIRNWDISPDGQQFLMVKLEARKSRPLTEIVLVQNWCEELKHLVPLRK